jgi:pimeloyl-ACP methyl ester carboxylesterase
MGAIVSAITATRDERVRRLVIGGVGAGIVEIGGVDTRVVPSDALADALERDDPATITDPAVAGFRQLADAIGADRLALAAQARNVHAEPIPVERITAPTLVLVGDDDPLAARPEVLSGRIPGARLVVVSGNHMSAVVAPTFAPTLVDFLGH